MDQGGKQLTIEKKNARLNLESAMNTAAYQVQDLSGGDEQLIMSAGFDVKRKPAPVGILERPTNVTAKEGPSRGSLEISWDVVPYAYIYEVKYTESPSNTESKWSQTSSTKHRIVINGLTRGKAYVIQVAAAGSNPERIWSDEIISYVM